MANLLPSRAACCRPANFRHMKRIFPAALVAVAIGFTGQAARGQGYAAASPLTATVDVMKHSVARLLCSSQLGTPPTALGSALFISSSGTFLTAAHVFSENDGKGKLCGFAAVALPLDTWNPQLREELLARFEFRPSDCKIDQDLDVARCRTMDDLSRPRGTMTFAVRAAPIEWNSPPDGTEVGVLGFPLGVRDPMISRAVVSISRTVWREGKSSPELLLDRSSLPGSSGSPVFLPDGRVVGIVVGTGTGDISGVTLARPAVSFRKLLDDPKE